MVGIAAESRLAGWLFNFQTSDVRFQLVQFCPAGQIQTDHLKRSFGGRRESKKEIQRGQDGQDSLFGFFAWRIELEAARGVVKLIPFQVAFALIVPIGDRRIDFHASHHAAR
jgi:hypothetical protein